MSTVSDRDPAQELAFNSVESWQTARDYGTLLGEIPSSFATTIRTLCLDQSRQNGAYGATSRFLVQRLLKGNSLKAPLYHNVKTYRPSLVAETTTLRGEDFMKWFSPFELGALIGSVYIYRRAKKLCDETEFSHLTGTLHKLHTIGMGVGYAIPSIGSVMGLFAGGMRHLASAVFLHYDKKGALEYRRHLKIKRLLLDPAFEMGRWGCTATQVGSVLLQSLGLGVEFSNAFTEGLSPGSVVDKNTNKMAYAARIAWTWVDSLNATGTIPDIAHDGAFYPSKVDVERLLTLVGDVRAQERLSSWLDKTKDDLPGEGAAGATGAHEGEQAAEEDVANTFSPDELKEVTDQLQDLLKE